MDSPEEAFAYDRMDHSLANRAFVADLLAEAPSPGWIVDLGAGTLQIAVLLCQRWSECRILAVDLAWWMLQVGRNHVLKAGLQGRVIPCRGDAKRLPLPSGHFRTVISNSLLHHLPEPGLALEEAYRVTAPGGLLFFRDLFRPEDEATIAALVSQYAPDADARQRQMFADSFRASLTVEEVRELARKLGIPGTAVYPSSDRHWTLCWRKPG
jgi:ubiquinone/menaquinone biosynthesis C-methylase UbiE